METPKHFNETNQADQVEQKKKRLSWLKKTVVNKLTNARNRLSSLKKTAVKKLANVKNRSQKFKENFEKAES